MSSNLFAPGNRRRSSTACVALLATVVLIPVPTPAGAETRRVAPLLAEGSGVGGKPSAQVRVLQRQLHRRDYELGPAGIDGRFGPWTAAAVRRMQADHGLAVDGVVGNRTRRALRLSTRSHTARGAQATSMHERASTRRSVTFLSPGQNVSADFPAFGTDGPASDIATGVVGGLLGAMAAVALTLHHARRGRRQWTIGLRRSLDAANGGPTGRHDGPGARPRHVNHDDIAEPIRDAAADEEPSLSELPGGRPVIGYVTVSTGLNSGDAVRSSAAIQATCERSNWDLLEIVADRENGRILERPGLGYALRRIAEGYACGLVVSDLQRLSRSIVDLGALMAWFRDANATLIALDLGIDTSTAEGDRVASTLIALSDCAHERIANRTRDSLAEKRANGDANGRPAVRDRPELMERIAAMRAGGLTLQAIADELNAEHVPTLRGGAKWRPSSIQAALGYRRPTPRDHLPRLTRDGP
jgi:DNA invertase Pin-like site-specific DNA recombinase